jgi:hypothetical protein
MTQRTRYFMFGSALVILVSLCTGLVAYYSGNLPLRASSVGPAELAYVAPDATAVAYADVRSIMDSEFRQRLKEILPSGTERDKLHAEIGVDIERDVDSVVAGLSGSEPNGKGAVVLVRGRFNNNLIESTALQHGATVEEYKGKRLLIMTMHAPSVPERDPSAVPQTSTGGGVAFLEPGLLALGETAAIKRAIDIGASGENVTKSAELMKFVSEMDSRSSAWVVGRFDAMTQNAGVPQELKSYLPPVQWFAANAHIDGGIRGMVRAEARDDQAGEQLRDVVRGALAGAQLFAGQNPQLEAMVKSLQVTGAGKDMTVSFTLPKEMLDMLSGLAGLSKPSGTETPGVIKK